MPITKHKIKNNNNFNALRPSSSLFIPFPMATVGSNTNNKTPIISSITNSPNTKSVNFCFLMFNSSNVLIIMVVEDIEIIAPRKKLDMVLHPRNKPP